MAITACRRSRPGSIVVSRDPEFCYGIRCVNTYIQNLNVWLQYVPPLLKYRFFFVFTGAPCTYSFAGKVIYFRQLGFTGLCLLQDTNRKPRAGSRTASEAFARRLHRRYVPSNCRRRRRWHIVSRRDTHCSVECHQ